MPSNADWRAAGIALMLMLSACTSSEWVASESIGDETSTSPSEGDSLAIGTSASSADRAAGVETFTIGASATDTFSGFIGDDVAVTPFDTSNSVIALLDPALLDAIQAAARSAAADGVDMKITSGWRSRGFQQRLFNDAVRAFGSVGLARQLVASPEVSKHVVGEAVDIGPTAADEWLIRNGSRFGLCQIYANEIWHFELAPDAQGTCPPLKRNAAG